MNRVRERRQNCILWCRELRDLDGPRSRGVEEPLPTSPLGRSDYAALDMEDGDGGEGICCDFSVVDEKTEGGEYDWIDTLDGIPLQSDEGVAESTGVDHDKMLGLQDEERGMEWGGVWERQS